MSAPIVAFCMGDPAGIGPELILKALSRPEVWARCRPLVIADPAVLTQIDGVLASGLRFHNIDRVAQAEFSHPTVDVLCPPDARIGTAVWGRLSPIYGAAAAACLRQAYELASAGQVHAVVSAPLNKEAFHRAGYDFQDELQWLAALTASPDALMMGLMRDVWTVAVAEHVAFARILDHIQKERILKYIRAIHRVLTALDPARARIAVAALNVHGGEGGLFGREELDEIAPAIAAARAEGIDAQGPVPADMVFVQALAGRYDGVVAMYHDQANIARKLQPMSEGATLFVGLPVYCGTTAHGTAFDIAGRGIADPGSIIAAAMTVARLARGQHCPY
ncbi:MAG: 4-hydroxythreonine-4-phosphate dehydrogenase PdxA [Chloroflexi bacterium]|nr:4-hydroxythreonine-4-phosphate dehydrogenase PdxA [Chloroflexota bacterium]